MGVIKLLLGVLMISGSLSVSMAFVPVYTAFSKAGTNTQTSTCTQTATMPVVAQSSKSPTSLEAGGESASRADFVSHQLSVSAVGVGVAVAGLAIEGQPAAADSTGKYSSKATAKKRYLPRIAKLVTGFEQLQKDINSGSASASSSFFVDVLPDAIPAMDLYGSSMKRGEYPDSKSRGLQQLANDFGSACAGIAKGLGKKGANSVKDYENAAKILEQYLKGTELDPIGSPSYQ